MEPMLNGSEKVPAQITDYKEYHTDKTVKVRVCIFRELCKFLGKTSIWKKNLEESKMSDRDRVENEFKTNLKWI